MQFMQYEGFEGAACGMLSFPDLTGGFPGYPVVPANLLEYSLRASPLHSVRHIF